MKGMKTVMLLMIIVPVILTDVLSCDTNCTHASRFFSLFSLCAELSITVLTE